MTGAGPGRYVAARDLEMYVETEGVGPDLVLLHGGSSDANEMASLRALLARTHRVLSPEQRSHGRTADAGALTYAGMSLDTARLLDALGLRDVDLVGWSDGGIVALGVARDRPDLVRRVVAIGANVAAVDAPAPLSAEMEDWFPTATAADLPHLPPANADHILAMWRAGPELRLADLVDIAAPVLVVAGDHDVITLEHTVAMFQALPDARLAILPGAGHDVPVTRPADVAALIETFLG